MTVIIDNSGYFAASEEIAFTDIEGSAGIEQLEGLLDDPGVRIIIDGFADGRFLTVGTSEPPKSWLLLTSRFLQE